MIKNLNNMDFNQKMQRCGEYIEALEEERRKIQVFQRELPLCLELVTQAIEACKRELSGTTTEYVRGQSECSEQTTGDFRPVLEEFIPIKRTSSCEEDYEDDDEEQESHESDEKVDGKNTKSDWLRSVQLWNQSPDPLPKEEDSQDEETVVEVKRNHVACQPYPHEMEKSALGKSNGNENGKPPATAEGGGGRKKEAEKDGGQRKQRRCWSKELHKRFLNALQHLGGAHVATPKQIRELMKVDGLTNDEVKSHLQKYRLHTRRPSQTGPGNGNPHTPHLVVVGGIWVPQSGYPTADAATAATTARIYRAAMAAPPPPAPPQWPSPARFEPLISEDRSQCLNEGGVRCNSPTTSSSGRTNVKDGKKF